MSDPADTIRRVFEAITTEDFRLNGCVCKPLAPCYLHEHEIPKAHAALDALLAEQQQAQEERDQIARDYEWAWEQRRQAIDALREAHALLGPPYATGVEAQVDEIVAAALEKLGEKP